MAMPTLLVLEKHQISAMSIPAAFKCTEVKGCTQHASTHFYPGHLRKHHPPSPVPHLSQAIEQCCDPGPAQRASSSRPRKCAPAWSHRQHIPGQWCAHAAALPAHEPAHPRSQDLTCTTPAHLDSDVRTL
eukprot:1159968-Pelagomonas_calceolata.AAC.6